MIEMYLWLALHTVWPTTCTTRKQLFLINNMIP